MSLADRIVDSLARKPGGLVGRFIYRHAFGHKAGFDVALRESPPAAKETVLEVGCGGGVFLRRVLALGADAIGVDHSADMIATSRALNADAFESRRLRLVGADAGLLPLEDASVDRVFCLNAFFFFPDPALAIAEMARVARPGAMIAILTAPPEFGPKIGRVFGPMADRMRFDTEETLTGWCRETGLLPLRTVAAPHAGFLLVAQRLSAMEEPGR